MKTRAGRPAGRRPARSALRGLPAWTGAVLATVLLHAVSGAAPEAATPLPGAEDCLACHEAGPPLAKRDADTPPRFDAAGLRASPHAKLACTACHADLDGQGVPARDEAGSGPLRRLPRHRAAAVRREPARPGRGARGEAGPLVQGLPRAARRAAAAATCARPRTRSTSPRCAGAATTRARRSSSPTTSRRTRSSQNYSESIHGEGLFQKGLLTTAVCTSCHTAHHVLPHTDPRSSIARGNVAATCTQCHVRIEQVHRKIINGVLWEKPAQRRSRPAWTATSRTRPAASSTPRAWPTTTA